MGSWGHGLLGSDLGSWGQTWEAVQEFPLEIHKSLPSNGLRISSLIKVVSLLARTYGKKRRILGQPPSRLVVFRFLAPRGFDGTHRYEVAEQQGRTVLRHVLEMHTTDLASLSWPLLPTTTRCVNRRQFGQSSCFAGECSSERGALVDFRASAPSRSQDASQST